MTLSPFSLDNLNVKPKIELSSRKNRHALILDSRGLPSPRNLIYRTFRISGFPLFYLTGISLEGEFNTSKLVMQFQSILTRHSPSVKRFMKLVRRLCFREGPQEPTPLVGTQGSKRFVHYNWAGQWGIQKIHSNTLYSTSLEV